MRLTFLAAVLTLGVLLTSAYAQQSSSAPPVDAPIVCAYVLDTVTPSLKADPSVIEFVVIDDPEFVGKLTAALKDAKEDIPDNVSRILVAEVYGSDGTPKVKYGLETTNGCLGKPHPWPLPSPFPAVERLSGKTGLGTFA